MHENQPHEQTQPPAGPPQSGQPWHPDEQVGDIYQVQINEESRIETAERLQPEPQIWVGSWLDYNNGVLHGQWINAAQPDDDIRADIQRMLAQSPTTVQTGEVAEDWGIFDSDNFGSLHVGEQESLAWVGTVARGIAEHGLAYAAYADVMQDETALVGFEDDYLGHYDSLEAYVEQLVDELGYGQQLDQAIPDHLRPYVHIDIEQLAHDMQAGGDIHVMPADDGGGVWIFRA